MKALLILAIVGCLLTVGSCSKFLEQYSQNLAFLQSADDLDELLVGEGYVTPIWTNQYLLDDDLEQNAAPASERPFTLFGVHQWQKVANIQSDGTLNVNGRRFSEFVSKNCCP